MGEKWIVSLANTFSGSMTIDFGILMNSENCFVQGFGNGGVGEDYLTRVRYTHFCFDHGGGCDDEFARRVSDGVDPEDLVVAGASQDFNQAGGAFILDEETSSNGHGDDGFFVLGAGGF